MRRSLGALLCLGSLATLSTPITTAHAVADPQAGCDTGMSTAVIRRPCTSTDNPVSPPSPGPTATVTPPAEGSTADEVLRLTNVERQKHGCDLLIHDPLLRSVAQDHSADMAAMNKLVLLTTDLIKASGFTPLSAWGGNLGFGYTTPAAAVAGWMSSASHRSRILNCSYTHTGVGYAYSRQRVPYWTQIFARH